MQFLIGHGIDYHNIYPKASELTLSGVKFLASYTIDAHSDGDIIYHALADAILGALGMGDIGMYWSDQIAATKNMDSQKIVLFALDEMHKRNYVIQNVDVTFISDHIYLKSDLRSQMRQKLQDICACPAVNLKATRHEDVNFLRADGDVVILLREKEYEHEN